MKIGFIGLGIMGKPMAKNLIAAGYALVVHDNNPISVEYAVGLGAEPASTPYEVAERCDTVITMLPNSPHVRQVVSGENGIIYGARPGQTLVDMSSISPVVSQELFSLLSQKGVGMLDAPVSGGEPKAVDGTLAIMVGGERAVFEQHAAMLQKLGSSVTYCGKIGAGNTTKLANQIIVALNIAALSEALVLGKKAGVDPSVIFEAIKGGLAGSTVMNAKAPMMLGRNFKPGFRIDLHYKDIANALETAREFEVPLPFTSLVFEVLKILRNDGKGALDHSGIVQFFEGIAKTELGQGGGQ